MVQSVFCIGDSGSCFELHSFQHLEALDMRRRDIRITFSASQFHLAPTRTEALPGTRCSKSRSAIFPPERYVSGGEILFFASDFQIYLKSHWSQSFTLLANLWKSLIGRATRVLSEDLKCFVHLYFRKLIIVLNLGLLLSGQDGQQYEEYCTYSQRRVRFDFELIEPCSPF